MGRRNLGGILMKLQDLQFSRRAILVCVALSAVSLALPAWAQGTAPPATPPMQTTAAPQPAPVATAPKSVAMPDSARAAFRAEVQRQLKQMADSLKLSPEQRNNARPILLEHAYQVKQLRDKYAAMEKTPANREAMTKEMQTLREATDAKLAGVLSGDQMAQYKKMRDEQLAKVRTKVGGGEPPPAEVKK
jgi:hypothetical protein